MRQCQWQWNKLMASIRAYDPSVHHAKQRASGSFVVLAPAQPRIIFRVSARTTRDGSYARWHYILLNHHIQDVGGPS